MLLAIDSIGVRATPSEVLVKDFTGQNLCCGPADFACALAHICVYSQ